MLDQPWFGSIIGILGLIIGITGIVLYLVGSRKPTISIYKRGISLIYNDVIVSNDIQVTLNGEKIQRLNKTTIYIWNDSLKAIRKSDIAPLDNLKIVWNENTNIYKAIIGKTTNEVCNPKIEFDRENREININFDYLNPNDGFRIDILNNDKSSSFVLKGSIIGSKKSIIEKKNSKSYTIILLANKIGNSRIIRTFFYISFGALIILGLFLPNSILIGDSGKMSEVIIARVGMIFSGVFYLGMFIWAKQASNKKYPESLEE